MKVNAFYNKTNQNKRFKIDNKILLVSLTMILAIVIGSIISIRYRNFFCNEINNKFISFYTDNTDQSFFQNFLSIIYENFVFVFLCLLSGTSIIGFIPVALLVFFKTIGLSVLTSYIFYSYLLKGLEFYFLIIYPGKILLIFTILFVASSSLRLTENIYKVVDKNENADINKAIILKQMLLSILLVLISALIDTILFESFSVLFNFS